MRDIGGCVGEAWRSDGVGKGPHSKFCLGSSLKVHRDGATTESGARWGKAIGKSLNSPL